MNAKESIVLMISGMVMAVVSAWGEKEAGDESLEACLFCNKKFGWFNLRHVCSLCGQTICEACLSESNYCPACMKYTENTVEDFPVNYHGNIYKPCRSSEPISTAWFRDKDKALKELKMRTAKMECDIIYNVDYKKEKREDGNYIFLVWQAVGIPAKRL